MKKVIVTGAGGFVGRALTKKLSADCFVYALAYSEKEKNNIPNNPNTKILVGDLSDPNSFVCEINDDIDIVYHLAWCGISTAEYKDINVQKRNFELSINAVKLAEKTRAKRFVFVGSNQEYVYGKNSIDNEIVNASIYGVCKRCCNQLCQVIAKDKMEYVSTAFTNVFGVGDYSKRTANVFIHKMLSGESLDLIEGNNLYDWTYIDDAVDGLIAAGFCGKSDKQYYIGNRQLRTFREIMINVSQVIGSNVELNFGRYTDTTYTDYLKFDLDALYNDTGFECKADFRESILKTAEWVKCLDWEV
ncbi:MAG: NAD(P)-dependent oxidoreductase [Oscillospiraceae bacterium]|nr:NAD(P)-dependent oxidoreductase [Oscillospiraceae bacterium]